MSYRLSPRECSAIIFYRTKMRMSISHIARLLERSSRSIWNIISKNHWAHKAYDKRKWGKYRRYVSNSKFQRLEGALSWFLELWRDKLIGNINLLTGQTLEGKPP